MARPGFTLYWSTLAMYEGCPQLFLWSKGWPGFDVGGGDGRPKPIPSRKSAHHALMGIAIQYAIERMYNDELWRDPKSLPDTLIRLTVEEWDRLTEKPDNWIDYNVAGDRESLLTVCRNGVMGFLRTMKANKIIGPYARAEVDFVGALSPTNPIGGRADLVVKRDDTGVTIYDGKNSQSKGKYTDPDQLRWYALLYWLQHRELPQRLAFIYYRYPYGTPILDPMGNPTDEVESGLDFVPFSEDDLNRLAHRANEARQKIEAAQFDPTPSPSQCKFCDYADVCAARQEQKANSSRKKPGIPEIAATTGFTDLEL